MRRFTSNCIDNKTRMIMVLSMCSYNEACSFLETKKDEIGECQSAKSILCSNGSLTELIFSNRIFIYDEERGYLLQKR
jgi:hypothetical protein